MDKKEYLIHIKLVTPIDNESDHYFGSLAAIYDKFTPLILGVPLSSLYSFQGRSGMEWTYHNQSCTIKKRLLIRKKHSK